MTKTPGQKTRAKSKQASIDKRACDRYFSLIVRSVGRCQRCGSSSYLQCAHIMSRRYTATRCDFENAWVLCAACHRRLTENPHEHVAYAVETLGADGYIELQQRAYAGVGGKVDWHALRRELKALAVERDVI